MPFRSHGFAGQVPVDRHAAYAVAHATSEGITIDLRQVRYDEDELLDLVRRSAMPEANWWLGMGGA